MINHSRTNQFLLLLLLLSSLSAVVHSYEQTCYYSAGKAKFCTPDFINAAFGRTVVATNTCKNSQYCVQTSNIYTYASEESSNRYCDICSINDPSKTHSVDFLTDQDDQNNATWWQSDTMEFDSDKSGVQYPHSVNLTLSLGKSFEVQYVAVKFQSSRPESFVIYKKVNETSDWTPYQYYSSDCKTMFSLQSDQIVVKENEAFPLCSEADSDIAPLSGANVVFGPLENRPSSYSFEENEQLLDWITATDIRIELKRLNTFGDEMFKEPLVLRSYFYAISDISVGGRLVYSHFTLFSLYSIVIYFLLLSLLLLRCKCHGHAEKCSKFEDRDLDEKYKCECKHNTDGLDCERCLPFYNDRPWAAATYEDANECLRNIFIII